jgi:hypothetical protein
MHRSSASRHRRLAHAEIDLSAVLARLRRSSFRRRIEFLINARNLLVVTALLLIIAAAALAFRARERRGYGLAIVGSAASVGILVGKFDLDRQRRCISALGLLIAASIWNSWPARLVLVLHTMRPFGRGL